MRSIDYLPSREEFGRPMYVLAIETKWNIKFLANDCPGCVRVWEKRLAKRGWIDLGPNFGLGRLAPIKRMWSTYGPFYDKVFESSSYYSHCTPEQIDQYDKDGLLYQHDCQVGDSIILDSYDQNNVDWPAADLDADDDVMYLDPEDDPWDLWSDDDEDEA